MQQEIETACEDMRLASRDRGQHVSFADVGSSCYLLVKRTYTHDHAMVTTCMCRNHHAQRHADVFDLNCRSWVY